jgi:mannosyl-oligosaccharide alpha-1,2-mannosidase
MELTRLSQLTGDPKWFDAAQRITDLFAAQQDTTELPGLWPLAIDAKEMIFNLGGIFTLGAMADSLYEYLPKMAGLTGGQLPVYQVMYEKAMDTAAKHNFFRPMTPTNEDILISGQVYTKQENGKTQINVDYQGQHLVCFIGGMLALGGKLFSRPQDVALAGRLTDGCIYTYKAFPHGIMPETLHMAPCPSNNLCEWDEKVWKQHVLKANGKDAGAPESEADEIISKERLPKGFTRIPDRRYILRPEAIESVFMLYRVTGRQDLADSAWDMFTSIEEVTKTQLANTAVWDVTIAGSKPSQAGSMESFWMGETLKYFYLVFSEPELISLDEYVFNTEAHPLKRLK